MLARGIRISFARQFLIYGVAGAASRLAAVVLVPLYTRMLSVGEYGELEVLLAVHALMVLVGGLQTESAVARDYFESKEAGTEGALLWGSLTLSVVGTLLVAAVCGSAAALGWLAPEVATRVVLLILMTAPAQFLGIQLVLLRFSGQAARFALLSFGDLTLSALASYWFIGPMNQGVNGALWGLLCGKLLCMLLAWRVTFGRPKGFGKDRSVLLRILRYGVPSLPAVIVNWLQNAGSRLILAMSLTLADVAIAGIAIKVAAIYGFVLYSFRLAWEPYSMAKLTQLSADPKLYNRALEWFVAAMFPAAGVASILAPVLVALLAPAAYAAAGPVAALFIVGQFWAGLTGVLVIGIHGARMTSKLLPVYASGVFVNIVILIAGAQLLGIAAAGIGFLMGCICSALFAATLSNRHFDTRFSRKTLGVLVAGSLVFAFAVFLTAGPLAEHLPLSVAGRRWAGVALLFSVWAAVVFAGFDRGSPRAMWALVKGLARAKTGVLD